ncbi:uncharacterized protein LOC115634545 [Scaptodrosophila lebanonensis]|uniref:Uncharacterized protein LOC115634545 n=1 Tax=Drosophila lebanonensis TaxID=7225 RepID=A0A6J2UJ49_DROLE|nr:uncharacterized protein LOC115634545 [Scaptodrosophila lebanonensis]
MSKNAARGPTVSNKTNPKSNELARKTTKSPATSSAAKTTTTRSGTHQLKKQDSLEKERALKKTTKPAANAGKKPTPPPPVHTNKNKERESVASKRTTPPPTTKPKVAATLRASKQPPVAVNATKAKPNAVLDTYHNVTVASPPQKRKVPVKQATTVPAREPEQQQEHVVSDKVAEHPQRARTLTRTLQPEEVVVLKRESAKQRIEAEIQKETALELKEPIAFEVNFGAAKKTPKPVAEAVYDDYSDDFESYESDFESCSSTSKEEEEEEDHDDDEDDEEEEDNENDHNHKEEEEDDESEPTQNPITVIPGDKEHERKLDSGHYDMQARRHPRLSELASQSTQHQCDSFDTLSIANSEQLDSGISNYGISASEPSKSGQTDIHFGGYANFIRRPVITRRGTELMKKLRFYQLQYDLFDMKPLSYEGYMQTYGKLNTCQMATQTQAHHMHSECQTMEVEVRSSWTQHPPHYMGNGQQMVLNCSGEAGMGAVQGASVHQDEWDQSLVQLEVLRQAEQERAQQQQRQRLTKTTDFERLNAFLYNAALLIGKVISRRRQPTPLLQTPAAHGFLSRGHIPLQLSLNALCVRRIFGGGGQPLLVTVHECAPQCDVYRAEFANLLVVWCLTDTTKPLRLLSTWAEVCRVEFCSDAPDIVVAGLRDGSVAMWDLRETYTYCSKLDGHLTHFAATQSVLPSLEGNSLDMGAVVDIRSFRALPAAAPGNSLMVSHKAIQYVSLNDSGLLTVWTLIETSGRQSNLPTTAHEYSSPWARVKLLQSAICDLHAYIERRLLRTQSKYDRTKSLFQGNVYSDDLLRELNETQTAPGELQGLRFTSIDTGCERIYVCTNRNFVLCCTKSLKQERFSRIMLNESRLLFPTALCVLSNEDFLAVGLSNGSIMIINCNQRQRGAAKPTTAMPQTPQSSVGPDPETGKSCAIQNIILNERRSFEQTPDGYDLRPNTAAYVDMIRHPKRAYELRVYDQQLLLGGNALRQDLVQALVLSSDGWRLFALSNGILRTYDFYLDKELTGGLNNGARITDIAVANVSANEQHLITLIGDGEGEVQLHTLN